jgi:hypothetical protein
MQPVFLKELIPHREMHMIATVNKNPFEEEESKDEEEADLNGSNIFEDDKEDIIRRRDGKYPISPASNAKKSGRNRKNSYSSKEIEMKSIIFN